MKISEFEKIVTDLKSLCIAISTASDLFGFANTYQLNQLESLVQSVKDLLPFKEGDRVKLAKTLDIKEWQAWYHSRHFLVENSPGTIDSISFYDGNYRYHVIFDDESFYSPTQKNFIPVEDKHTFAIYADQLIAL